MAGIRSLAKDTAVYGLSSIVGRFLNWLLVPLYTNVFVTGEYGVVTYVYSIVAVALIILTYGMETGFFRFANHDSYKDPREVYTTALISLGSTSSLFLLLVFLFLDDVTQAMDCTGHPSYAGMMAVAVALDAVTSIPFAWLRFRGRALRFATLKLIGIGLNIGFNLWFILLCPWLDAQSPGIMGALYDPGFGIGYIFLSNLISSAAVAMLLIPELRGFAWRFNSGLWKRMIVYSFPLLILGLAGVMNQSLDKILLPELVADKADAMAQVGIYGANYKIAVVMVMFIQAFRFAYEPFIFSRNTEEGGSRTQAYSSAMKFFVIFAMIIFLGVMFYLDILRYFISPRYFSGLKVVPIVMIAEFFFGIFYNLSVWYKLTDRTIWGTWFSLMGLAVTVTLNVLLVPRMGYMGCAWAALACYATMMTVSWAMGRKRYPIPYQTGRMCAYFAAALALYGLSLAIATGNEWADMGVRTILLALYVGAAVRFERIPIPRLHRIRRATDNA